MPSEKPLCSTILAPDVRRRQVSRFWLFSCTLVVFLTGCAFRLRPILAVNGQTPVTNANGDPATLGAPNDFLHADSQTANAGRKLVPGDVIYLRRWSLGESMAGQARPIRNSTMPISALDRIPLRMVASPGCSLYDYERQFLISLLTTNRRVHVNPPPNEQREFADFLLANECAFWNRLVDALVIKRYWPSVPASSPNLILTADLSKLFADPLCGYGGAMQGNCQGIPASQRFDRYFQGAEREIAGIEQPSASPYLALAGSLGQGNDIYYVPSTSPAPPVLFDFARVDLNGVSAAKLMHEEEAWSLQEWEDSQICYVAGHVTRIRAIVLRSDTGRRSGIFLVNRDPGLIATHEVRGVFTQSSPIDRGIRRSRGYHWYDQAILDAADLKQLTMADVKRLDWEYTATTQGAAGRPLPMNCRPK